MAITRSRALGSLVNNLEFDNTACIPNDLQSLYKRLIEDLSVDLPSEDEDTFIVVSSAAPEDRSKLWLQTAVNGFPQRLNIFRGNRWVMLEGWGFDFPKLFLGDPNSPQDGWTVYEELRAQFVDLPSNDSLYYAYFTG